MFASTKMGGMCLAFPDTCNVPAAPSPIPTPFPNIAQCPMATSTAEKVKIMNSEVLTKDSKISRTNGDEAGTAGGVSSGTFGGEAAFIEGSTSVKVEGSPAIFLFLPTKHNGTTPNAPGGAQIVPSQVQVLIMS